MRFFPGLSVNPCRTRAGMGGRRRKILDRLWAWAANRGWRKSRPSIMSVVVVVTLLWLLLISVLNFESGVDYSTVRDNAGIHPIRRRQLDRDSVFSGRFYYLKGIDGEKDSKYENPDAAAGFDKKDVDSGFFLTSDSTLIKSKKLSDYKMKRSRHSEDHMDNVRMIPGRRIQEIGSVKSGGLENRKLSVLRGTRKTPEIRRWRDESMAAWHGQTNTVAMGENQVFYETRNEDFGRSKYHVSSSSFPPSFSATESATDTNTGERKTAQFTPGNIPALAPPTNWGKLEPKDAHAAARSPVSAKIKSERNPSFSDFKSRLTAQNSMSPSHSSFRTSYIESDGFDVAKKTLQNTDRKIKGGSVMVMGDIRYGESPKMAAHVRDLNRVDGVKGKTGEIDKAFFRMNTPGFYSSPHQPQIGDVDPINKQPSDLNHESFKGTETNEAVQVNSGVSDKEETLENLKFHNKEMDSRRFSKAFVTDEKDNKNSQISGDDKSNNIKISRQQIIRVLKKRINGSNSPLTSSSFSSSHHSDELLSSSISLSQVSSKTMKIAAAASLPTSAPTSSSLFSPSITTTTTTATTTTIAATATPSRPHTSSSQMRNERGDAGGNLRMLQSNQMIAASSNDETGKKEYYGLPPLIRVDTRDREVANRRRQSGAADVGKPVLAEGETGRKGTDRMEKLGDKKFDISRDDSATSRHVINATDLGNVTVMVAATTRENKNDDRRKMKNVTMEKQGMKEPLESDGFIKYAYNVTSSDAIGSRRGIPDTRPMGCDRHSAYSVPRINPLPRASVVICFHNEAMSVLLRTVHSVLDRTPVHMLDKVILVDDYSTDDALVQDLPSRVKSEFGPNVTITRTSQREGLVRARLLGSSLVTSEVIVFLDAHVECNEGWMEPLLYALRSPGIKVVSPYIDTIKADSFEYRKSPSGLQGGFNWRMEFGWRAASEDWHKGGDETSPIQTPVISGGLFAVRRDAFLALGGYDPQLEVWGGENLELSFKTWMCGGSMFILPCSRVGHVFRATLPYEFKDGDRERTVLRNLGRVARVWMDGYADVFEAAVNFPLDLDIGNLTEQKQLRQGLQCKSFHWYLNHVHPQLEVVTPSTLLYGQVKNKGSLMCIQVSHNNLRKSPQIHLSACKGDKNQTIHLTTQGHLKMGQYCIVPGIDKTLTLSFCRENFTWLYQAKQIHPLSDRQLCMTSIDNELIYLLPCDANTKDTQSANGSNTHISKMDSSSIIQSNNNSHMKGDAIFQQWEFQYSFHWKRKRRRG